MKKYEFVVVVHPNLAQEDVNTTLSNVESMLWDAIREKDDIWYQTVYNVRGLKNYNQAYFVSYLIETEESEIVAYNKKLSLIKWLLRYVFLARKDKDPFHKFLDINSKYLEKLDELDKKKNDEKKANKKANRKTKVEKEEGTTQETDEIQE